MADFIVSAVVFGATMAATSIAVRAGTRKWDKHQHKKNEEHVNDFNKITHFAAKTGYLYKAKQGKGHKKKEWKLYKFALVGCELFWFEVHGAVQQEPINNYQHKIHLKGHLDLRTEVDQIVLNQNSGDYFQNSFAVYARIGKKMKVFLLGAETQQDIQDWMDAIAEAKKLPAAEISIPPGDYGHVATMQRPPPFVPFRNRVTLVPAPMPYPQYSPAPSPAPGYYPPPQQSGSQGQFQPPGPGYYPPASGSQGQLQPPGYYAPPQAPSPAPPGAPTQQYPPPPPGYTVAWVQGPNGAPMLMYVPLQQPGAGGQPPMGPPPVKQV